MVCVFYAEKQKLCFEYFEYLRYILDFDKIWRGNLYPVHPS